MGKKLPQYLVIAQDIIDQIQNGSLHAGDQIMTETQLCEIYQVSRMTVNKALITLVNRGYISRTAGKGTFVLEPKVTKFIGTNSSFSADMKSIKKEPGAILLEYRVQRASNVNHLADYLKLSPDELVHQISRIRTGDGIKIAISHTYIPCKYLPAIDVTALEGSLYEYLEREYQIHPFIQDYSFSAILPTEEQCNLLDIDSCALLLVSHSSGTDSVPLFEYTETYYAGNRYVYRFTPEKFLSET